MRRVARATSPLLALETRDLDVRYGTQGTAMRPVIDWAEGAGHVWSHGVMDRTG